MASSRLLHFTVIVLLCGLVLQSIRPTSLPSRMPPQPSTLPGDALIPSPEMLYTHSIPVSVPVSIVFPWILQLGKSRGGWYLPSSWERVLPRSIHAARQINPAWTALKVGDVVPDYGFSEADFFVVSEIVEFDVEGQEGKALVYKSERYGTVFSWSIIVRDISVPIGGDTYGGLIDGHQSEVILRFRGRVQRTGWQKIALVWGGGVMDWATTWPMLRGLKERAEQDYRSR